MVNGYLTTEKPQSLFTRWFTSCLIALPDVTKDMTISNDSEHSVHFLWFGPLSRLRTKIALQVWSGHEKYRGINRPIPKSLASHAAVFREAKLPTSPQEGNLTPLKMAV